MTVSTEPLHRLTSEAVAVLVRELGLARTLRFLDPFGGGEGDYRAERDAYLAGVPLADLAAEARALDARRLVAEPRASARDEGSA